MKVEAWLETVTFPLITIKWEDTAQEEEEQAGRSSGNS